MTNKPSGFIFYKGPSMLDSKPIVAILTGLRKSTNAKTGAMLQTWILRADMNPLTAVRLGHDVSICGGCKARGVIVRHKGRLKNTGRVCYVRLDAAPNTIFKTYKRRRYPFLTPAQAAPLILDRKLRIGSYGDPAAVPVAVWDTLRALTNDSGTAYTHQWRNFPELAAFAMASVDTPSERAEAKILGFRTFRVRSESDPLESYEVACPASAEAGHKTTCHACVACGGHAAKAKADITIIVHADRDRQFAAAVQM